MPPLTRNKGKRIPRRPPPPPTEPSPAPRETSPAHAVPSPTPAEPSPPPQKPEQPKPQSTTQPQKQPKKQPQPQQPPRPPRQWPIPPVKVWREEGEEMSPLCKKRHENSQKLFSLKIHMDGEMIIDENGKVKYDGGIIRYVDWFRKDDTDMWVLGDVCSRLGLDGLSIYLYLKPGGDMNKDLRYLRKYMDVKGMCSFVPGVRMIDFFVIHPTRRQYAEVLLKSYDEDHRKIWPTNTVIEEVGDEEAKEIQKAWESEQIKFALEELEEEARDMQKAWESEQIILALQKQEEEARAIRGGIILLQWYPEVDDRVEVDGDEVEGGDQGVVREDEGDVRDDQVHQETMHNLRSCGLVEDEGADDIFDGLDNLPGFVDHGDDWRRNLDDIVVDEENRVSDDEEWEEGDVDYAEEREFEESKSRSSRVKREEGEGGKREG